MADGIQRDLTIVATLLAATAALYVGVDRWAQRQPRHEAERVAAPAVELPRLPLEPDAPETRQVIGGGGPVIVHFFASWCTICQDERPFVDALHRRLAKRSTPVLGIAVTDDRPALRSAGWVREGLPPVLFDGSGTAARRFGVAALPETILVDGSGRIAIRHKGPLDADRVAELEHAAAAERFIATSADPSDRSHE